VGAETPVYDAISTHSLVTGAFVDTAHNTVQGALQTAQRTWSEAFRLSKRELDLLAKILDKVGNDCDLLDSELGDLVTHQDTPLRPDPRDRL